MIFSSIKGMGCGPYRIQLVLYGIIWGIVNNEKYLHYVNDLSDFDPFSFSFLNLKLVFNKTCHG